MQKLPSFLLFLQLFLLKNRREISEFLLWFINNALYRRIGYDA